MKTLLILGDDKISGLALEEIGEVRGTTVVVDRSTNAARVLGLIRRGTVSLRFLWKTGMCELFRNGRKPQNEHTSIVSNKNLMSVISDIEPDRIILFRAGLIITKKVIRTGVPILNIHCANIPQYGGLGSIERALKNGDFEQNATLHRVTEDIDSGEIVDVEPYVLEPDLGYCENEMRAYVSGIRLLRRELANPCCSRLI